MTVFATRLAIRSSTRTILVFGLLATVGLSLRVWLTSRAISEMNSDEFYTGLQAMAILEGDRPIILRGIGYTAVVDSYLLAPIYWFTDAPITFLNFSMLFGGLSLRSSQHSLHVVHS